MVHPDMIYVVVEVDGEKLIIAKERLLSVLGEKPYKIIKELKGQELEGISYVPPLLALQNPTHTTSHRPVVHQSHQIQTENDPGEQESPMDTRMGRIQTIQHMASWRPRLGHQPPTLLGNPTPRLDMPRMRRTFGCRFQS